MTRVLVFGAFDPLHEGHRDFFRQAKALGDYLKVVVARDSSIRANKGYEPHHGEEARLKAVAEAGVDEVMLGQKTAHKYEMLQELEFDVIALGYDQEPLKEEVRRQLALLGKQAVQVVRLQPFHPEKYKSTFIRGRRSQPDSEEKSNN